MAGLAAAIELRAGGLGVVVAEARGAPGERFGETVPPGTLAALDRLGLGEAFRADGHVSCPGGISRWGDDRIGHNDAILDPLGPAWHVDRARLESMLRARAVAVGVGLWAPVRAVWVSRAGEGWRVGLRVGSGGVGSVRARWVLDATGGSAWFARRQGARRAQVDRMVALIRLADLAGGTFTAQTVVESSPAGWWYGARLPGGRLVTALVTDPDSAGEFRRAGRARWHAELERTCLLAPRLAGCTVHAAGFRVRSVTVSRLDRVAAENWLAVGDAAAELDPIGGRGIHDALVGAADAAWTVAAAYGLREPPPWRYPERVRARFADHLQTRAALYQRERRWPDSPFWRGRAG